MRRIGAYGKLLANYASDDAIIAAGEAAELLFCRAIAFLSTSDTDGYLTEAQVHRYVGAGLRKIPERVAALVREGLWAEIDGGYQVRSYLKINESAAEKGRKLRNDRERKRQPPETIPEDSARNPDGIPEVDGAESPKCTVVNSQQSEVHSSPFDSSPRKRATRITDDWTPTPDDLEWQHHNGVNDLLARRELDKFRDYWRAKSGKDATKLDWSATWRNWLRNTLERQGASTPRPSTPWGGA